MFLNRLDAPPNEPGESVGVFAAVRAGGTVAWPADTLTFDITDAVTRLGGQEVRVELVPFRIRAAGEESHPPLAFRQMRVFAEQR